MGLLGPAGPPGLCRCAVIFGPSGPSRVLLAAPECPRLPFWLYAGLWDHALERHKACPCHAALPLHAYPSPATSTNRYMSDTGLGSMQRHIPTYGGAHPS